jgi:hypothetical protein
MQRARRKNNPKHLNGFDFIVINSEIIYVSAVCDRKFALVRTNYLEDYSEGLNYGEMLSGYTGCRKFVPFAGFPNRRACRVQRIEIITNMTTAMLLERLDQAILAVSENPERTQQTAAIGTLF